MCSNGRVAESDDGVADGCRPGRRHAVRTGVWNHSNTCS